MAERQRTTRPTEGNEAAAIPAGPRVLGLDIGGTASRARLCAGSRIVAESRGRSASLPAAGLEGAAVALAELLAELPLDASEPLDAICAGSAGLSVPGAREFLAARLGPLTLPGRLVIVSDAMLVLPAAGVDAGVAVICGTGSIAVGTAGGRSVQTGGWGYLLGDEGSGYWIVREAVRELLGRRDRGCPPGALGEQLVSAAGAADLGELQRRYLEQPHRPRRWARYAELVLASPDPAAADIRARAASAVAALAAGAMTQLAGALSDTSEASGFGEPAAGGEVGFGAPAAGGEVGFGALAAGGEVGFGAPAAGEASGFGALAAGGEVGFGALAAGGEVGFGALAAGGEVDFGELADLPVVLGGGLFASGAFAAAARAALRDRLPQSAVSVLTDEPVAGAVRLAALTAAAG